MDDIKEYDKKGKACYDIYQTINTITPGFESDKELINELASNFTNILTGDGSTESAFSKTMKLAKNIEEAGDLFSKLPNTYKEQTNEYYDIVKKKVDSYNNEKDDAGNPKHSKLEGYPSFEKI